TFTHWVLFDIASGTTSLAQNASGNGVLGTTSFGKAAYGGPCPPAGKGMHRYFFKLYAIDMEKLGPAAGAARADVEAALAGHALAHGVFLGGPLIEDRGDGRFANATLLFDPLGNLVTKYRKRHPWYPETWATPGEDALPVVGLTERGGARVTIACCFDL